MGKINTKDEYEVIFTETLVRHGEFSEDAINAQKEMHCKAAKALLMAAAKIQGIEQDIPEQDDDKSNHIRNTVSLRTKLSIENCINLADRIARQRNSDAYEKAKLKYSSMKQNLGPLNDMTPQEKGNAMAALKSVAYSCIKISVQINLPETVYIQDKTGRTIGNYVKSIRTLSRYFIAKGPTSEPSEEHLQTWAEGLMQDIIDEVEWITNDSENDSSPSSEKDQKGGRSPKGTVKNNTEPETLGTESGEEAPSSGATG